MDYLPQTAHFVLFFIDCAQRQKLTVSCSLLTCHASISRRSISWTSLQSSPVHLIFFFFITGKGALELERREKVDIQEVTFDFGTLVSENGV